VRYVNNKEGLNAVSESGVKGLTWWRCWSRVSQAFIFMHLFLIRNSMSRTRASSLTQRLSRVIGKAKSYSSWKLTLFSTPSCQCIKPSALTSPTMHVSLGRLIPQMTNLIWDSNYILFEVLMSKLHFNRSAYLYLYQQLQLHQFFFHIWTCFVTVE
jgi:hypothetical protein